MLVAIDQDFRILRILEKWHDGIQGIVLLFSFCSCFGFHIDFLSV
jgi:hypothetical protein